MSFPLYDIFTRQARGLSGGLNDNQLKRTTEDIKTLDQDGINNLYLIIRYAANLEKDEKIYNAKYNRKGVVFNLEAMPELLQKTIYLFVQKHLEETQNSAPSVDIVFE
jgi:F0F1-type ATP synthase gamma subunit